MDSSAKPQNDNNKVGIPTSGNNKVIYSALLVMTLILQFYLNSDRLQIGVCFKLLLCQDDLLHLAGGDDALLLMRCALAVKIHADVRVLVNISYAESDRQLIGDSVGTDGHGHSVANAALALHGDLPAG